jgi:hypothetical protein
MWQKTSNRVWSKKMKTPDRNQIVKLSYFSAGLLGLFGIINLTSGAELGIADGLFNMGMGVILFFVGLALKQGKKLAFYLVGLEIVASLIYGFSVGRGINFVMIAVGAIWFIWLYSFWKNGELK